MRIATFNANSLRARLKTVLEWMEKEDPDVLCIQETKVPDPSFPVKEFTDHEYRVAYAGEKTYNGVAIISKKPLSQVSHGFEDGSSSSRLISADVSGLTVVNTYIPQGLSPFSDKFREKLDWMQRLFDYFRAHFKPEMPILWVGDFNVAPEAIDVYDPELLTGHVAFHPDVHAALRKFSDWGFVDIFRIHHPEKGHYTFWDYTIRNAVKKGMGWRIDHIWATKPVAKKCRNAWIDVDLRLSPKPSDHAPVVAVFDNI
jgi:exodeoxyribonuclease-3